MPNLLRRNSPLQEKLLNSLMILNDRGQLTYLIKELNERKILREAEIFIFITLCLDGHPELINHPERHALEKLYNECFANASSEDLLRILEKPHNIKIKELLYAYLKHLVENYKLQTKKKVPAPPSLLDTYVHFLTSHYLPQSKKIRLSY